jgi:hypothetical protein
MVETLRGLGAVRLYDQRRGAGGVAAQDQAVGRGVAADAGVYEQSLAGAGGGDGAAVEDVDGRIGRRRSLKDAEERRPLVFPKSASISAL